MMKKLTTKQAMKIFNTNQTKAFLRATSKKRNDSYLKHYSLEIRIPDAFFNDYFCLSKIVFHRLLLKLDLIHFRTENINYFNDFFANNNYSGV